MGYSERLQYGVRSMVIDFVQYVETMKARQAAEEAARQAELARRAHLEAFLTDLLAELMAA